MRNLLLLLALACSTMTLAQKSQEVLSLTPVKTPTRSATAKAVATQGLHLDALDYAAISQRVIAVCDESRFQLLEALADHLAAIVLAEFSIERLRMTITKPGAVAEAEGVGVVIDRP